METKQYYIIKYTGKKNYQDRFSETNPRPRQTNLYLVREKLGDLINFKAGIYFFRVKSRNWGNHALLKGIRWRASSKCAGRFKIFEISDLRLFSGVNTSLTENSLRENITSLTFQTAAEPFKISKPNSENNYSPWVA